MKCARLYAFEFVGLAVEFQQFVVIVAFEALDLRFEFPDTLAAALTLLLGLFDMVFAALEFVLDGLQTTFKLAPYPAPGLDGLVFLLEFVEFFGDRLTLVDPLQAALAEVA